MIIDTPLPPDLTPDDILAAMLAVAQDAAALDVLADLFPEDDDTVIESYTPYQFYLLSEAGRAGLVLKQVGTHPRTGKPVMRYVRAEPKAKVEPKRAANKAKAAEAKAAALKLLDKPGGSLTGAEQQALAGHMRAMDSAGLAELRKKVTGRGSKEKKEKMAAAISEYVKAKAAETPATPAAVTPTPPAGNKTLGQRVQGLGMKVARWAAEASGDNQWLADNGFPEVDSVYPDGKKVYRVKGEDGKSYRYDDKAAAETAASAAHAKKKPDPKPDPKPEPKAGSGGGGLGSVIDGIAAGLDPTNLINLFGGFLNG
jgi:hypothetical protein